MSDGPRAVDAGLGARVGAVDADLGARVRAVDAELGARVRAVRRGAGVFALPDRGLVTVSGSDATRWLDGMVSNDVKALVPGPERSGCPALVLTRQGRIVADLHVLRRDDGFWLELARSAVPGLLERLGKLLIADDVTLADASDERARIGVEGPRARALLESASGGSLALAPDACSELALGDVTGVVARFGWTGEDGYQLFVPLAAAETVRARLLAAGDGVVAGDAAVLEVLRVEAGVPRLGAELSEEVLPPEVHLERAVSYTKGCYTGQEVVARLRSRGEVAHLLVGLRFAGDAPPPPGTPLVADDGRTVGELTSAVRSPAAGAVALGFVRRAYAAPGTGLAAGARRAEVAALPFVAGATAGAGAAAP